MSVQVLSAYDPYAEEQYDVLHSKFRAQFYAAFREKDGERRREIKDACYQTLYGMRRARIQSYKTPQDVAALYLNKVRFSALRRGVRDVLLPEIQTFQTLKDLLNFAARSNTYIDAHIRREPVIAQIRRDCGVSERYPGWIMTVNPSALNP